MASEIWFGLDFGCRVSVRVYLAKPECGVYHHSIALGRVRVEGES